MFRRRFLTNHLETIPSSADDIIHGIPDMPCAEAEAEAARLREMYDPEESIQFLLPGIANFAELELLNPHEFFVRWLEGQCPRTEIRELVEAGEIAAADAAAVLDPSVKMWKFVAVGRFRMDMMLSMSYFAIVGTGCLSDRGHRTGNVSRPWQRTV